MPGNAQTGPEPALGRLQPISGTRADGSSRWARKTTKGGFSGRFAASVYNEPPGEPPAHACGQEWLDRPVRLGDDREAYLRGNPLLKSLRVHPRFQQFLDAVAYRRKQRPPG